MRSATNSACRAPGNPHCGRQALRRAQHTTVHQLHATGQVSTRTLIGMAGVASGTIQRWIHHPTAVTLQGAGLTGQEMRTQRGGTGDVAGLRASGSSPTRARRVSDPAVMGGKRSGHVPRAPTGPGCPARTRADDRPNPGHPHPLAAGPVPVAGLRPDPRWRHPAHHSGGGRFPARAVGRGATGTVLGQPVTPDHITALQAVPGWDWGRTNADRWTEGLTHLRSYLDEHVTTTVDTRTVHQGFALGAWVARRRSNYHQGTLSPTRIAALEAITGWEWNPYDTAWRRMFTHLQQAAHHHGSVAHITQTAVIDGVNVGHWVMDQRTRHRQGRLGPDRVNALQALPGWDWAPRAHQRPGAGGEPANTK